MIGLCSWAMIFRLQQIPLKLPSHQFQNAPSEIFGSAPGVNICEIQKKGRSVHRCASSNP